MNKRKEEDTLNLISSCLAQMVNQGEYSFIGRILQSLSIKILEGVGTLGIWFNDKSKQFELVVDPEYFTNKLNGYTEQKAALIHEIEHILHKHVFFYFRGMEMDKTRLNMAQDLVINQLIQGAPKDWLFTEKFRTGDGQLFPKALPTETYYNLMKQEDSEMKVIRKDEQGNEVEEWMLINDVLKKGEQLTADQHLFNDGEPSDQTVKDQLEAVEDLLQKTIQKHGSPIGKMAERVNDILREIDGASKKMNYAAILKNAIRTSLPSTKKEYTWKRPSKRFGELAQGKKSGTAPKIEMLCDTSGSMSCEMVNENLAIANNVLLAGVESATIRLFHDFEYHSEKIKKNFQLDPSVFRTGGTNLTGALEAALKRKPELIIILTDGEFNMPNIDARRLPKNMVFIITGNGNLNHPLKGFGTTIEHKK